MSITPKYEVISDTMRQDPSGKMEIRTQVVVFRKRKAGNIIEHRARIITYVDQKEKKAKLIRLLTNDFDMEPEEIIGIYRKRWQIETLFKQIKQNFPLRYFYGESANAIKIQIWVTLIANLLLTIMQRSLKRSWSFSNLATMVRIMLMYYVDFHSFFEHPEKDWQEILSKATEEPPEPTLFSDRGLVNQNFVQPTNMDSSVADLINCSNF